MHCVLFVGISPPPSPQNLGNLTGQLLALLMQSGIRTPIVWMESEHTGLFIQVHNDQAERVEGEIAAYIGDQPLPRHSLTVHLTDWTPSPATSA